MTSPTPTDPGQHPTQPPLYSSPVAYPSPAPAPHVTTTSTVTTGPPTPAPAPTLLQRLGRYNKLWTTIASLGLTIITQRYTGVWWIPLAVMVAGSYGVYQIPNLPKFPPFTKGDPVTITTTTTGGPPRPAQGSGPGGSYGQ